jgi:hypothetical protein
LIGFNKVKNLCELGVFCLKLFPAIRCNLPLRCSRAGFPLLSGLGLRAGYPGSAFAEGIV